ncbi:MAG: DNA mismatch repair protein MutT, partial [Cytophagia bacterium]|nr:DNA mismatch repair protein MutT [Cytophagia bacterium]
EELSEGKNALEDTEADMQVKKVRLSEAIKMIAEGTITDSMSVAGILYVARLKNI